MYVHLCLLLRVDVHGLLAASTFATFLRRRGAATIRWVGNCINCTMEVVKIGQKQLCTYVDSEHLQGELSWLSLD